MASKKTLAQKRKQTRIYAILGMLALVSLGAFLVIRAFEENILFFVTPSDLIDREISGNEQFRLGGLVEPGSYIKEEGSLKIRFVVTDGGATIPVEYEGLLPDLFEEGQGVVVEGVINSDGVFVARTILAKHDENYMPAEVADALKEKGYWQDESDNSKKEGN